VKQKDHALSAMLTLTFQRDRIDRVPAADLLASSLSLQGCDVLQGFQAGIGVKFSFIQLASRAAVDRAALHTPSWVKLHAGGWSPHIFLFAGDLVNGSQIYARIFCCRYRTGSIVRQTPGDCCRFAARQILTH